MFDLNKNDEDNLINKRNKAEIAAFVVAFVLPTIYVISEYYFGLNAAIANFAQTSGVPFWYSMPLAVEYLAFSALFFINIFLFLGSKGLKGFALPGFFAALVGVIYTIDNVFPNGQFTPFQLLVPTTAGLAAKVLGWMGYATSMSSQNGMPVLQATGPAGSATFSIAWPCAGIESLLIFTAVSLLFLQQMHISWKAKVGYFAVGASVTYFINVMRIVTIFTIGAQYGVNSSQVDMFHFYYGPLYAIAWIVSYPLIILLSQGIWRKIKPENGFNARKLQPPQQNPV